ncbi:ankyrin repeat domain-containing protein 33B isoform X3 [Choloepus didactylus]|uniref:ankyrin repeat domain-containing protein 33B isoform X3 n=1 Tax=Choloepus didactylus TaxID=27675 RepID=UPI00189CFA36|nr:ankyrin repeat domain-containing protein 33B isoform X3 [Choloepus didactylus]
MTKSPLVWALGPTAAVSPDFHGPQGARYLPAQPSPNQEPTQQETDRPHHRLLPRLCGHCGGLSRVPPRGRQLAGQRGEHGPHHSRAGHATITNYLLNYFPGLDLERRNAFGFTALMKAAMQGRAECIRALMLAGADVHARDPRRGMTPQEWAAYTGRSEAVRLIQRLLERPCPQQFGGKYKPELQLAPEAALKPAGSKNCLQRLREFVRSTLTSRSDQGPEDGGALDHMVRVTTSLYSPAVAIVCQTVCPENPPCVGKRRLAVQEILGARGAQERDKAEGTEQPSRTSQAQEVSREDTPRAGLPCPQPPGPQVAAPRKASLLPLPLPKRGSVRPGVVIPRVRVSKAPAPTFQPERPARKGGAKDSAHLQIPKWRYKEAKEEKRRAEEAEKQRRAEAQKERRAPPWWKRT